MVVSHTHFDHVGGLCEMPNARIVVNADEWAFAMAAGQEGGFDTSLVDLGHDVLTVDGEHDLFGDGAVTCIPTPGHTCGHQSLRVVTADGPVILTSDACYFTHTLDDEILPPFGFDHELQRRSLAHAPPRAGCRNTDRARPRCRRVQSDRRPLAVISMTHI